MSSCDLPAPPPDPPPPRDPPACPLTSAPIPGAGPGLDAVINRQPSRLKRWLTLLGPGLTSGAANNDPSAVATYAKAGAAFGFALLWVAPVVLPMMAVTVYVCAKLGMITGMGLAGVLRKWYPRPVLYLVIAGLVTANTIAAGADLGAIAAGLHLLIPQVPPLALVFPIALLILVVQIWCSYRWIASVLKWLTLTLFAFVAAGLLTRPDPLAVLQHTFVPTLRAGPSYVEMLVAIVGTALSPYLFFWQTSQRVEEKERLGRRWAWQRWGATPGELHYAWWDVVVGIFFACVIIYFIILSTAGSLHQAGHTDVSSAAEVAQALAPLAGRAAGVLFAAGFIGAGILAVPVLTGGAAYALADTFGLAQGLDRRPHEAKAFYAIIAASTLVGAALNFVGINPIRALVLAGVINGVLAAPVLALLMLAAGNRRILRDQANGWLAMLLGWLTVAAATAAALALAWSRLGPGGTDKPF